MLDKVTAVVAMVGLICAAGLDSENWLVPMGIMVLSFGWVAAYGFFRSER